MEMFYQIIFVPLILFQFVSPISTTRQKRGELDGEAMIAFVGGNDKFDEFCAKKHVTIQQNKASLAQIYGIYLGALFYLRKEWDCEKAYEFKATNKPDACDKFHQILDILYEDLYNVYTGHSATVQPKFEDYFLKQIYSLFKIMKKIAKIWKFDLKTKYHLIKDGDETQRSQKIKNSDFIWNVKLLGKYELYYKTNDFDKKRKLREKYVHAKKGVIDPQSQQLLTQNYGSYLDSLAYLNNDNWNIVDIHHGLNMEPPLEQETHERFFKHLELLREYWSMVAAKTPAVMPKFEHRNDLGGSDFDRLTRVMKNVVDIWKCDCVPEMMEDDDKEMVKRNALLYIHNLVLKNEEELDYSAKDLENVLMPENKVIGQRSKEILANYFKDFDYWRVHYYDYIHERLNVGPLEGNARERFFKHLCILREYWSNVDAELPAVMPKFENRSDLDGSDFDRLKRVMKNFVDICKWWCRDPEVSNEGALNALLYIHNLELKNEKELNYGETTDLETNANVEDESNRAKFDEIMEKMAKKAEKRFLEGSPFNYDMQIVMQDEAFVGFVRDKNNLVNIRNIIGSGGSFDYSITLSVGELEERLVALYLMKRHWNCANVKDAKFEKECSKSKQSVDTVYEYLCNVHAGFTGKKQQFELQGQNVDLLKMVDHFSNVSRLYFGSGSAETAVHHHSKKLIEEDNSKMELQGIGVEMAIDWRDEKQQIKRTDVRQLAEHNFEQYIKNLHKKWIKKALVEKAELEALAEKIDNNEATFEQEEDYLYGRTHYKNHQVYGSPFFSITL